MAMMVSPLLEDMSAPHRAAGVNVGALTIVRNIVHIRSMNALSFSETRANLKAVMDRVVADKVPIAITRQRGQEGVVMISESEWASIEETLYLLQSPKNAERLLEAIRGLEAGKGEEHELIEP
ncbi:type II toxin-antitoxin system Phd/YefM family antitoxin [Hephaestia mangrovi]|uniref:type II toxin-antitoxin system Phd/YefM family antitoxin n=1 Tax=Hephaestia mangrovi TaxID=2873268 RepID=UPI0021083238|nr:type II toxin-antitoxin system prevent-host-death family antitoxin [Hephaestia mangrovi]